MKKKIFSTICFVAIILSGCTSQKATSIDPSNSLEPTGLVSSDENQQEDRDKIKEAMTDFITDPSEVKAVNDIDFGSLDFGSFPAAGDSVCFNDVYEPYKSVLGDNSEIYYSFIYEDSTSPVMSILVTENPNYIDENNIMFFVAYNDGQLHLTEVIDTHDEARTENYLGKNGIFSTREYPTSNVVVAKTAAITLEGELKDIFSETIISRDELSYSDEYEEMCEACYKSSMPNVGIGKIEINNETHFCLYELSNLSEEDEAFKKACEDSGIVFESREDIIKKAESYATETGTETELDELDENKVEWIKAQ